MNQNCLEGMRCPKCQSEGPYAISARAVFTVFDDGVSDYESVEWENSDHCTCLQCNLEALVSNFQI